MSGRVQRAATLQRGSVPGKSLSRMKLIVFSIIPVVGLLAFAELSLRVWANHLRTPYERYNYTTERFELIPNVRRVGVDGEEFLINSKGFVGPEFDGNKREGVYRIFALGDSCTFGTGYWRRAYPAILERLLNLTEGKAHFEVINAGIEGYSSDFALARLREELLSLNPDMVIIYIGWNDLMKVNPNNLSAAGRHTWVTRLMQSSYLMRAYNKILFYYLRPLVVRPQIVEDAGDIRAFDDFVPLTYQDNLEAMVGILQGRGIVPLLVTLPTVVTRGMTHAELKQHGVFFPYYAGTYSVDKLLSLHRAYNETIRRTAVMFDVPLVDLDAAFNTYDKRDLFWDTMHPSEKGHRLIAEEVKATVLDIVARQGTGRIVPGGSTGSGGRPAGDQR